MAIDPRPAHVAEDGRRGLGAGHAEEAVLARNKHGDGRGCAGAAGGGGGWA